MKVKFFEEKYIWELVINVYDLYYHKNMTMSKQELQCLIP
jgi:hypothetical protein